MLRDGLQPWNEPEKILEALVSLGRELPLYRTELHALIEHHDEDVREQAVRALFVTLRDQTCHWDAVKLLRDDPSSSVRRVAAFGVEGTSSPGTREADAAVLVDALGNPAEDPHVRRAAYEALLLLFGRRDLPPGNRDIDLETEVDWAWIKSLKA